MATKAITNTTTSRRPRTCYIVPYAYMLPYTITRRSRGESTRPPILGFWNSGNLNIADYRNFGNFWTY